MVNFIMKTFKIALQYDNTFDEGLMQFEPTDDKLGQCQTPECKFC